MMIWHVYRYVPFAIISVNIFRGQWILCNIVKIHLTATAAAAGADVAIIGISIVCAHECER